MRHMTSVSKKARVALSLCRARAFWEGRKELATMRMTGLRSSVKGDTEAMAAGFGSYGWPEMFCDFYDRGLEKPLFPHRRATCLDGGESDTGCPIRGL